MNDMIQTRLAEQIYRERLEEAERNRHYASRPATISLLERLRGALGATVRPPVLPAQRSPRKLHS